MQHLMADMAGDARHRNPAPMRYGMPHDSRPYHTLKSRRVEVMIRKGLPFYIKKVDNTCLNTVELSCLSDTESKTLRTVMKLPHGSRRQLTVAVFPDSPLAVPFLIHVKSGLSPNLLIPCLARPSFSSPSADNHDKIKI